MKISYKKIMIFGRPGSGKSTFSYKLSIDSKLHLYHLDKYFFTSNWVERDYEEFLILQQDIINANNWIIDGNSLRSLEMRWQKADIVLYFNMPKLLCLFRLIKRRFLPNKHIDDRAEECNEVLRWKLITYMWNFEQRVSKQIETLQEKYPNARFIEIRNSKDIGALRISLRHQLN